MNDEKEEIASKDLFQHIPPFAMNKLNTALADLTQQKESIDMVITPLQVATAVGEVSAENEVQQMVDAMWHNRDKTSADASEYRATAKVIFKRPAAASQVKKTNGKAKPGGTGKPKGIVKPKGRSIHVEASVNHVLARTGLDTYPKSTIFPFKTPAGITAAKQLATKWLKSVGG